MFDNQQKTDSTALAGENGSSFKTIQLELKFN